MYLKEEFYKLIRNSTEVFDFIQENALDGLWYWDIEKPENEWMNEKFWKTFGYDPLEMPQKSDAWQSIIDPDDLKIALENFHKHCEDPSFPYDITLRYLHKNGKTVWIRCRGVVLRDKNEKPIRMVGAHIDVTKQKESEIALEKRIERYGHIIEGTDIGTWEWNLQTGETNYNERWAEMLGYTLADLEPITLQTWKNLTHPEDLKKSDQLLDAHIRGETQFYEFEARMKHKMGHWVWILDKGKVVSHTSNGEALLVTGSHQEITEKKEKDLLLIKYKNLLERTNEAGKIGTWELDNENNTIYWSKITKQIHEVDANYKPRLEKAIDFYPEGEHRNKMNEVLNAAFSEGKYYDIELQIKTAKGNLKWVRATGIPEIENNKCIRISGIFQDVDDIKKVQLAIAFREEQFRQTFRHSSIGMALIDLKGKWIHVNKSLCDIIGYSSLELKKLSFKEITHPDDLTLDLTYLKELFEGKRASYQMEKRYFHKNGEIVWVNLSVSLVRNDSGQPIHYVSQIENITEKKNLIETMQDQNKRLINFAYIVSHNLRSHTGNISMLLDIMEDENPSKEQNEYYKHLRTASVNLSETVEHLNEVVVINTKVKENLESLNLYEYVKAAQSSVSALSKSAKCIIENSVDKNIKVLAIPAYLESIILNFLTNAIKYRSPERKPIVKITSKIQRNFVILKIEDNGLGIDLKTYGENLFGMYKTFHQHEDARGIGLFITKNQIESIGGKIEVESEVNKGSIFKIFFKLPKE